MKADRILLSSNDWEKYLNFFPIVATAWKKFYDVPVSFAFVTERTEDDPLISKMREYADVHLFAPVDGVPTGNQAKMARFFLASQFPEDVCLFHDVDTAPLSSEYFKKIWAQHVPGSILAAGADMYIGTEAQGKFPIGDMTALGSVITKLVNPTNLEFGQYIYSFQYIYEHDAKEDIRAHDFSDESLFRVLVERRGINVVHIEKPVDIKAEWIDRSWWEYSVEDLHAGKYTIVNFLRPLMDNIETIKPIIDYIYGEETFEDIF